MANGGGLNGHTRVIVPTALAIGIVGAAFTLGQMIGEGQGGSDALERQVRRLAGEVTALENKVATLSKTVALLQYRINGGDGRNRTSQ